MISASSNSRFSSFSERIPLCLEAAVLAIVFIANPAQGGMIPDFWLLSTGITGTGNSQGTSFVNVLPNFINSHSVHLNTSDSSAQYAIVIENFAAQYDIHVEHTCVNVPGWNPICNSSGRIDLTPRFDVLVTVAMDYAYTLPTDPTRADFGFSAYLPDIDENVYSNGISDTTDFAGPHSGSRSFTDSFILPANRSVTLSYIFRVMYRTGSANGLNMIGDGNLHMTMTALPEPGTLGMLGLGACALARRERRR